MVEEANGAGRVGQVYEGCKIFDSTAGLAASMMMKNRRQSQLEDRAHWAVRRQCPVPMLTVE